MNWSDGDGQARQEWLLRVAGVPEEYRGADIRKCRLEVNVRAYCAGIEARVKRGEGAVILGPTGTGKSSTAALIAQAAVRAGIKPRWEYVPDLTDRLLDTRRRGEARAQQTSADLLIWDDLNVRPLSEFEVGLLDQIVDNRYRRRMPMVVTSNMTVKTLQEPMFARMADRWRQRNKAWVLSGASMREFVGD